MLFAAVRTNMYLTEQTANRRALLQLPQRYWCTSLVCPTHPAQLTFSGNARFYVQVSK